MNPTTSAAPSRIIPEGRRIGWFGLAVFVVLWMELISRLRFEWSINPQYGYGWTVPFLAAFIFWKRFRNAPAPSLPSKRVIPGLLIFLAALLLIPVRLIQEANPDWRLLSWAMALSTAVITSGVIYLVGGTRWVRHFAFPILFFFVGVPWPTQLEQLVIQGLMRADARINVEILNTIGIPALQMGNVIEVGSGLVGIDEACTGIRSLQATLMVSLFLGEFYNLVTNRRVLLVLLGASLAFLCNLGRTFLLVWLSAKQGTIESWHDPAGYTILTICLFGLWGLSLRLRPKSDSSSELVRSAPGFPIPLFILGSLLALILLAEATTQIWYRTRESSIARTQPWSITWPIEAPNWQAVPIENSAQELLRYNEGGGGTWAGEDGHQWNMFFFRWLPGRTAGLFVRNHRPDICLPASGMEQRGSMRNQVLTINGIEFPIRSYVFESAGRVLHVFYCYWDGTTPERQGGDHENWTALGRLEAVRKGKRDVGTQMLELIGWDYPDDQKAEQAAIEQLGKILRRS